MRKTEECTEWTAACGQLAERPAGCQTPDGLLGIRQPRLRWCPGCPSGLLHWAARSWKAGCDLGKVLTILPGLGVLGSESSPGESPPPGHCCRSFPEKVCWLWTKPSAQSLALTGFCPVSILGGEILHYHLCGSWRCAVWCWGFTRCGNHQGVGPTCGSSAPFSSWRERVWDTPRLGNS